MADENTKIFKGMPLSGFPASAMQYALDGAKLAHQSHSGIINGPQQAADKGIIHVKNTTGDSLPAYSVVGLSNAVVFDETQNQRSYQRDPTILGVVPDEDEHEGKFAILLQPLKDGRRGLAMAVGVSYCKVDVTDEDHEYADVTDGETEHLVSGETGFARILRKPSGTGVLECVVRLSGGAPSPSSGGGNGGGESGPCCGTCYPSGSVEFADLEWATNYEITLPSPIGTVVVTDQGGGVWESDEIEVTCGEGEDEEADIYVAVLAAAGVGPGDISVTVSLLDGGGCEGDEEEPEPCCCEFAWKYTNCCIVDPLCGFQLTRDPRGISGRDCHDAGCTVCVSPLPETIPVTCGGAHRRFTTQRLELPATLAINMTGFDGVVFFSRSSVPEYHECIPLVCSADTMQPLCINPQGDLWHVELNANINVGRVPLSFRTAIPHTPLSQDVDTGLPRSTQLSCPSWMTGVPVPQTVNYGEFTNDLLLTVPLFFRAEARLAWKSHAELFPNLPPFPFSVQLEVVITALTLTSGIHNDNCGFPSNNLGYYPVSMFRSQESYALESQSDFEGIANWMGSISRVQRVFNIFETGFILTNGDFSSAHSMSASDFGPNHPFSLATPCSEYTIPDSLGVSVLV